MKWLTLGILAAALVWSAGAAAAPMADTQCENNVDPPCPNVYRPGDTIDYVLKIRNPHPSEQVRVDFVEDTLPDGTSIVLDSSADASYPDFPFILNPGTEQVYNLSWTIPLAWVGPINNLFESTGAQLSTVEDPFNCIVNKGSLLIDPCIIVTKTPSHTTSKAGDIVTYNICVENCGLNTLDLVSVTDDVLGDLTSLFGPELGAGAIECVDVDYTVRVDDPDPLVNVVTANYEVSVLCGSPTPVEYTFPVSDDATATVDLVHPDFTVVKECITDPVVPGGTADFRITIDNIGDVDLVIDTDEDDIADPFTLAWDGPAFEQVVTKDVPVELPDPPEICNEIVVTATLPPELNLPNTYEERADDCCNIIDCCLDVTKTADPLVTKAGHEVTYEICVVNCGENCDLTRVSVIDDRLGDLTSSFEPTLPSGETECHTFTYTVMADDPDPLINTVTAIYEDPAAAQLTAEDDAEVDLLHPDLTVSKVCLTDPVPEGSDAEFEITIDNTGDVDLIITTDEPAIPGPITLPWDGPPLVEIVTVPVPAGVSEVCNSITVTATLPPDYNLDNTYTRTSSDCCGVPGLEGCTPGFWKNHPNCWCEAYDEEDRVGEVFDIPSPELEELADDSLMDALRYHGGPGALGKARNLLRHGVAALLNACGEHVDYPLSVQGVIDTVNEALETLDEHEINMVKDMLNDYNELGCPINAKCEPEHDEEMQRFRAPTEGAKGELPEDEVEGEFDDSISIPPSFVVGQAVPNPFNHLVKIGYGLPVAGNVKVEIYDAAGRRVANLIDREEGPGYHYVTWDGRNDQGRKAGAGVYFYRVRFNGNQDVKKMMLMDQ